MRTIKINLPKLELSGELVSWKNDDPGFRKYAGSVYFDNKNYVGFLLHDGRVVVNRNNRFLGCYLPAGTQSTGAFVSKYFDQYGKALPAVKVSAEELHFAILERHGIKADVAVRPDCVLLAVETIQSMTTMMKMFNRLKPIAIANGEIGYLIKIVL
jgi:hypothetical protein